MAIVAIATKFGNREEKGESKHPLHILGPPDRMIEVKFDRKCPQNAEGKTSTCDATENLPLL
jgi:hypothetical protein